MYSQIPCAWRQFGPSLGVPMDRRAFTLQPLIAQGILHPGDNRLSCAVGGIDYFAGKMPESIGPMHRFLLGTVRSGPYDKHSSLGHSKSCTKSSCFRFTVKQLLVLPSLTLHPNKQHISVELLSSARAISHVTRKYAVASLI